MYPIHPDTVYILDRVYRIPSAEARLNAMLANLQPAHKVVLSDRELHHLVGKRHWTQGYRHRTGFYRRHGPPTLIFNTFRPMGWNLRWHQLRYPRLNHGMLAGQGPFTHRSEINHLERNICQAAWEMHSIFGCLHACDYCHVEDFVNIMLNIEDLISDLQRVITANPSQQLYKYDNLSDIFAFEPEYNACLPLIEFFAHTPRQYLLLYSKSDNIDFLLNADHQGHTIINWSISPQSQASLIEKGTPPLDRRVKAMEKCQEAGYTVRARFSPLIPIRNWQQETADMVKLLFYHAKPDVITLDVVGFMSPKVMREAIDTNLFDPQAVGILEDVEKSQRLFGKHTFPHEFRRAMFRHVISEIRKYAPTIPISVCNETKEMWRDLSDLLSPMAPDNYVCCCGPTSVPGHPFLHGKNRFNSM